MADGGDNKLGEKYFRREGVIPGIDIQKNYQLVISRWIMRKGSLRPVV